MITKNTKIRNKVRILNNDHYKINKSLLVTWRVTLAVFQWLYPPDFEPVLRYFSSHFLKCRKVMPICIETLRCSILSRTLETRKKNSNLGGGDLLYIFQLHLVLLAILEVSHRSNPKSFLTFNICTFAF